MNLVKKAAKILVIGLIALTLIRPMSSGTIPRLPPIQMLGQVTETVHLS